MKEKPRKGSKGTKFPGKNNNNVQTMLKVSEILPVIGEETEASSKSQKTKSTDDSAALGMLASDVFTTVEMVEENNEGEIQKEPEAEESSSSEDEGLDYDLAEFGVNPQEVEDFLGDQSIDSMSEVQFGRATSTTEKSKKIKFDSPEELQRYVQRLWKISGRRKNPK